MQLQAEGTKLNMLQQLGLKVQRANIGRSAEKPNHCLLGLLPFVLRRARGYVSNKVHHQGLTNIDMGVFNDLRPKVLVEDSKMGCSACSATHVLTYFDRVSDAPDCFHTSGSTFRLVGLQERHRNGLPMAHHGPPWSWSMMAPWLYERPPEDGPSHCTQRGPVGPLQGCRCFNGTAAGLQRRNWAAEISRSSRFF